MKTCFREIFHLSVLVWFQLFLSSGFSQVDTLYFDIDGNKINKHTFKSKFRSKFYDGIRYAADTLVVEELMPNHIFGQLSPVAKSQLFKILSIRNNIDTLKILSIFYKDTLLARNEFPKKDYLIFRDSLGNVMGISKLRGWYFDGRAYREAKWHERKYSFKNFNKICYSNFKNHKRFKHVTPVFFYGFNKGLDLSTLKVKWYQDYGFLIKKLFMYKNYWFQQLILKPNGEFFIRIGSKPIHKKELFDEEQWNAHRDAYFSEIKINKN